METVEKKSWGGSRAGAGRKADKCRKRTIAIRVPDDIAALLDAQPNKSDYIIDAIRAYSGLKPAEGK